MAKARTEAKIPLHAIEEIVNYLLDSEEQNFFENACEDDHPFLAAVKVAKWLNEQPDTESDDWGVLIKLIEKKIADARDDDAQAA